MAFGRWLRGLVMAALMTVGLGVAQAQSAPLLVNPGFDDPFVDFGAFGLVAEGWEAWSVESLPTDASPLFGPTMPDLSERVLAGDNAQLISSTLATATAGVFQSATVPENAELVFEVNAYVWSSLDGLNTDVSNATEGVSVEVGIDPLGGIDPLSAGIMWSAPLTTYDAFQAVSVTATAQGTQVTVFVRVMVNTGVYAADVYLDEGILVVAGEQ
nr:hypothetical protein [Anaerolineae bacterium]